jgi:carboxyl-terminal processing protease
MHPRPDGRGAVPAIEQQIAGIITRYGTRVEPRELVYGAIRGELAALHDPYSVLFTKRELTAFTGAIEGRAFAGIGVVLASDDPQRPWRVDQVFPNGPAARAGLQVNDVLVAVEGTPTAGASSDGVVALLRGPSGTIVHVTIERNGVPIPEPVAIRRAAVTPPSVSARRLSGDVAYVTLRSFDTTAASEVHDAFVRLAGEGTRARILDLRGNGGGYESAAVHVASLFVASGPVVTIETRGKRVTTGADGTALPPQPLVVLVDGDSASAAELVAAAIRDRGAGRLVGARTFGKGVVQTMYPLPDGAAIKLTTARYFTPAGRNIDRVGIAPDVAVAQPAGSVRGTPGRDPQLDRALAILGSL